MVTRFERIAVGGLVAPDFSTVFSLLRVIRCFRTTRLSGHESKTEHFPQNATAGCREKRHSRAVAKSHRKAARTMVEYGLCVKLSKLPTCVNTAIMREEGKSD